MKKRVYLYTPMLLFLYACQAVQPLRVQSTYYSVYQQSTGDSSIKRLLNPYRLKLRDTLQTVVAFSYQNWLNKAPDYALGNLLADALAVSSPSSESVAAELALVNGNTIRGYWPKGNIRLEQFFHLLPADDYWGVYDIAGIDLLPILEKIAIGSNWSVSNGISIALREGKVVSITIQGKPLDSATVYRLSVWEGIPTFGLERQLISYERKMSTVMVRDALVQYCQKITQSGKPLSINKNKRIYALD